MQTPFGHLDKGKWPHTWPTSVHCGDNLSCSSDLFLDFQWFSCSHDTDVQKTYPSKGKEKLYSHTHTHHCGDGDFSTHPKSWILKPLPVTELEQGWAQEGSGSNSNCRGQSLDRKGEQFK